MYSAIRIPGVTTGQIWAAGLGAAVLSGLVAAGTALLVVWLTGKGQDRRAQEERARNAVRDLIVVLHDWTEGLPEAATPTQENRLIRKRLERDVRLQINTARTELEVAGHLGLIKVVQGRYALIAFPIAGDTVRRVRDYSTAKNAWILERFDYQVYELLNDLNQWLRDGTIRTTLELTTLAGMPHSITGAHVIAINGEPYTSPWPEPDLVIADDD